MEPREIFTLFQRPLAWNVQFTFEICLCHSCPPMRLGFQSVPPQQSVQPWLPGGISLLQRPPPVCHEGIKLHRPGKLPLVAQKKSVCRDEVAGVLGNMNNCYHQHIASPWYWTFDIDTVCLRVVTIFVICFGLIEMYP